ncbi:MAG: exonuclease SbcCD subunit D [bacterium]
MKIAITADVHLTTFEEHPERFHALENILKQVIENQVKILVIAGDLFDASRQNYAEFDTFCQKPEYKGVRFLIIPGNHDLRLRNEDLVAANVDIVTEPAIKTFHSPGLKFLLLPYQADKTMGEFIAANVHELPANDWVLIGHGDWAESLAEPNPAEPGVYMPLTRTDIENYKPATVVLGHIHKPLDKPRLHYLGSPCGLDITETGRRRFLIMDVDNGAITEKIVGNEVIYFNESMTVLPLRDEDAYVKNLIERMITSWRLNKAELSKVQLRLEVQGYTTNKRALMKSIKEGCKELNFHNNHEPDLTAVAVADDFNRAEIANQVSDWIEKLDLKHNPEQPTREQILLEALHVIYGN